MQRNAWNSVASWLAKRFSNFTKSQLHVLMTINSKKKNWNPLENCRMYALKLFWHVFIWGALVDLILCGQSTNLHARYQKWTRACDKRQACLISYIHFTSEYRHHCHVGNTAKQCRLGLFRDSGFAGDLEDSKSTSDGTLCIFGSHLFVLRSWMCKNKTSVSHSSTESEIISLDAGLRMDGIHRAWSLGFGYWCVTFKIESDTQKSTGTGNPLPNKTSEMRKSSQNKTPASEENHGLSNVDFVSSNANSFHKGAMLYIFEGNEAVITRIFKRRSPTMRHVSISHRVALDRLFELLLTGPQDPNQICRHQKPTRRLSEQREFHTWWMESSSLFLLNISMFSSSSCSQAMSKRMQEVNGEERIAAKSKPKVNLVSRNMAGSSTAPSSTFPRSLRANSHGLGLMVRWNPSFPARGNPLHGTRTKFRTLKLARETRCMEFGNRNWFGDTARTRDFCRVNSTHGKSTHQIANNESPSWGLNGRSRQAFVDVGNVCVFNHDCSRYLWERLLGQICIPSEIQKKGLL